MLEVKPSKRDTKEKRARGKYLTTQVKTKNLLRQINKGHDDYMKELDTLEDSQLPFFIEWLSSEHPSKDGKPIAKISSIKIAGSKSALNEWLLTSVDAIFEDIDLVWVDPVENYGFTGIVSVTLMTPSGLVELD